MSTDSTFLCSQCGRHIPIINQVIHQVQCRGKVPSATVTSTNAPNSTEVQSEATNVSLELPIAIPIESPTAPQTVNLIDNEPFWECPVCTFHNFNVAKEVCDACGIPHERRHGGYISSAPPLNSSTSPSSSEPLNYPQSTNEWACEHCTCLNDMSVDRCAACDNIRPPQASHSERLIPDDPHMLVDDIMREFSFFRPPQGGGENPNFTTWNETIFTPGGLETRSTRTTSSGGVSTSYTRTSSSHLDDESSRDRNQQNTLTSSALLGAGLGAGLALLQRRSVMRGALEGAGLGLLGGFAANALEETLQEDRPSQSAPVAAAAPFPAASSARPAGRMDPTMHPLYAMLNLTSQDQDMHRHLLEMLMAGGLLDGTGIGAGVSEEELSSLPTHKFHETANSSGGSCNNKDCSICLEQYQEGDQVRTLPCLHHFHSRCIDTWLNQKSSCPVCKTSIRGGDR